MQIALPVVGRAVAKLQRRIHRFRVDLSLVDKIYPFAWLELVGRSDSLKRSLFALPSFRRQEIKYAVDFAIVLRESLDPFIVAL